MTRLLVGDPLTWSVAGPTAVMIGVFDGVHLGHQAVARETTRRAHERGLTGLALTFDPHPLELLAPARAPRLLTSVTQRVELLAECGVGVVGVLPFGQVRDLAPESFAIEVLSGRLQARTVGVGADFRFGRDRAGDVDLLRRIGSEEGFVTEVVDLIGHIDGEVVSSTRIRGLLERGDVESAARLLGRPFELRARVIHGDGRGRSIGFPTANLHVPRRMAFPRDGVYAAWVRVVNGHEVPRAPAVVNIGFRPTFDGEARIVEAHLIGFDDDLYGAEMSVRFVGRLRDERRFSSIDALVAQIEADVERGRQLLEVDDEH